MDRLEQAMTNLTWLKGNANKDHEEEMNLPRDLPQSRSNLKSIPEFDVLLLWEIFEEKIY